MELYTMNKLTNKQKDLWMLLSTMVAMGEAIMAWIQLQQ